MISDTGNASSEEMEGIFAEWNKTWSTLLEGTNIRQRVMNELYGNSGNSSEDKMGGSGGAPSASGGNANPSRRQSIRPVLKNNKNNNITHNNINSLSSSELNANLRTRLCYELRTNADADFQLMQQLNELKNKRDALHSELRDITIETRKLERIQKDGGADDADLGTVKLIKRLENEVSKLDRVVNQELDKYNQNLLAVDTFCTFK